MVLLNMFPVNRPEVIIANASEQCDVTDEAAREHIRKLLQGLVDWAQRIGQLTDHRGD